MQPRMPFALFATEVPCWLIPSLLFVRTRGPSLQITFPASWPQSCKGAWGYSHLAAEHCISFAKQIVQAILVDLFLQPVEFPWKVEKPPGLLAAPPSFVSSVDMLRVHFLPLFRLLIKRQNSIGPIIDPWSTFLVTSFQMGFVLLVITLWAWQLSQFSFHLTSHFSS